MSAAALKVTTEARPSSRLAVTVTVPGERCKTSYEDAITNLSRSINLPGFRKGKVPRTVLVQQLGGVRIKATALEKLIDNAWRDAIKQESLEPISQPDLSSGFDGLLESFEPGKELTFTLEADVAPTPKLKTTKGLTAFGVVLQPLLQVFAQVRQGFLFAGLLGEFVIQLGQFAGLEVLQFDLEGGLTSAGVLLRIVVRELALHGFGLADLHADDPFDEAGDHPAVFQVHIHRIGTAAFDLAAVIAVGALEAEHSDVAVHGGTAFHRHDRGHLLAGILKHRVDPGGVVGDGFKFRLQSLGGFQLRRRGDVGFQGEGEFFAGLKALQQAVETTSQIRLTDRFQRCLLYTSPSPRDQRGSRMPSSA